MVTKSLSYREAEAILEQLAGPSSMALPQMATLAAALAERRRQAVRSNGDRARKTSTPPPTWDETAYAALIEGLPDALVVFEPSGKILLANARVRALFGYRREELLGTPVDVLVPELVMHSPEWSEEIGQATVELHGQRKDGREFPVEVSFRRLPVQKGILIASTIRDVSDRKRLEARYRNLIEGIPAVTFLAALDEGGNELYVSPQIEQLLGFSQKEWLEDPVLWFTQLHPDDQERWHLEFAYTCATATPFRSVYRFIARDGRVVWVQGEAKVVRDSTGRPMFLQGVAFDITERKNAEEALQRSHDELEHMVRQRTAELAGANRQLQAALKEKESLLKEIHHRVKNNLQIISSLLNLQSASVKDQATLQAIRESQNRVRSMALVHQKLYQSHDLARIDFAPYVRELVAHLVRSYGASASNVYVKVELDDTSFTIDTAIPCGLIVTELVSNCLKHAFPQGRAGEIAISICREVDGTFCLIVRDNGVGLPEGFDPSQTSSLGLTLVGTLAGQLQATLEIESNAGTCFQLRFHELLPR